MRYNFLFTFFCIYTTNIIGFIQHHHARAVLCCLVIVSSILKILHPPQNALHVPVKAQSSVKHGYRSVSDTWACYLFRKIVKTGSILTASAIFGLFFFKFLPCLWIVPMVATGKGNQSSNGFFSREYVPEIIQIGSQDQRNRYLDHKPYTEYYQLYILYLGIASLFHLRFMISWSC